MKACVFGAGAIGGHLAGRLHAGGAVVSVVARGSHLRAMQEHGLRVEWARGTLHAAVRAASDPAELGPQDHVLVCVKAPALPSVAAGIAPLLGPGTTVTFAMNGIPWWYFDGTTEDGRTLPALDPGNAVRRAVGVDRTAGGVVFSSCTVVAPGVVRVETPDSRLTLGEPRGGASSRLDALAAVLRQDGLAVDVAGQIRDVVWGKLFTNICNAPLGVLSQSAARDIFADPACCDALRQLAAEGHAVARAMGVAVAMPDAERMVAHGQASGHKSSIVQDLELGRPMEVEAILGVPQMFARDNGVATPLLDLLLALVKLRAGAAGLYQAPPGPPPRPGGDV